MSEEARETSSRFREILANMRQSPLTIAAAVIISVISITAIIGPFLSPYDPIMVDMRNRFAPPSLEHLMGTDSFGRDIFSRVIYGSRISLVASFSSVGVAMALGMVLGLIAGFRGGWLDNTIMRIMDIIMAFPTIVLMIVLMALVGASLRNVIFVIAFIFVPQFARVTRSAIISEKVRPYVLAERALGASEYRVMFLHVLPNSLPPIIVVATMYIAVASLIEAAVGFLGAGVPPPIPTWGNMLKEGQAYIFSGEWWMSIFPGAAIFITVLAFNLLGDGIRDALDPTLRRFRR